MRMCIISTDVVNCVYHVHSEGGYLECERDQADGVAEGHLLCSRKAGLGHPDAIGDPSPGPPGGAEHPDGLDSGPVLLSYHPEGLGGVGGPFHRQERDALAPLGQLGAWSIWTLHSVREGDGEVLTHPPLSGPTRPSPAAASWPCIP